MLDVESCKILIVGNCIFRRGVAGIVRDAVPSALIAEAICFSDARARLSRSPFFAAIFDIDADGVYGPISFQMLRVDCPALILGVLSRTASAGDILGYLAAGVSGYIFEESDQSEVERGVREILSGAVYIPPDAIASTLSETNRASLAVRRGLCGLTPRQIGVLRLLLKGYSNKEIARQLNLSPNTVKIHVGALLRRFAVQRRSNLAVAAATLPAEAIDGRSQLGSSQGLRIAV
jgi:DNA-binding NarL/FixJ family response regulator